MTNKFNIFYYEDNQATLRQVERFLKSSWSAIEKGVPDSPERMTGFDGYHVKSFFKSDRALNDLDENAGSYHLFIVDLYEEKGDNNLKSVGISIIKKIKEKSDKGGILAISGADEFEYDAEKDFNEAAKREAPGKYNTHGKWYCSKTSLLKRAEISPKEMAKKIIELSVDSGVVPS